jgi:hypothetical protein
MKIGGRLKWVVLGFGVAAVALVLVLLLRNTSLGRAATWQQQVSPGHLSSAHAFLENNCAACHTAMKGPEAAKCIACHANNESLLQRQPTAFHADIGSCRECHPEHLGGKRPPSTMDHADLAKIGLRQLGDKNTASAGPHAQITPLEARLDCASCHGNKDPHLKFFGQDCAQCHGTDKWTIPEYRHPSPSSKECSQCHQAPPSHYMEHFHMVSMKVAGKPHAQVNQCYLCHQTTAWNDIKGVGFYKHH